MTSGGFITMQDAGRAVRQRLGRLVEARPGLAARLRLFGLLLLLFPLFAGLQYMIGSAMPRVEVRVVSQDVPVFVPVERIVERVVERPIYVPVPADATLTPTAVTPTPTIQPGGTPTPSGADPSRAGRPSAGTGSPADAGALGAVPGGLTAIGAMPVGPGSGATIPGIPPGGIGAPPIGPGGVAVSEPRPVLVAPTDARPPEASVGTASATTVARPVPPRSRAEPMVVIATEDRLGPSTVVRSAEPPTVRVERETRGRSDNRPARRSGGGQSTASISASDGLVVGPAGATPVAAHFSDEGRPRTSAIPAPIGVKPPPEE